MSKKKAVDYHLSYVHPSSPQYAHVAFLDKKGRTMMSSVDVVLNMEYLDEDILRGYLISR